MHPNNPIDPYVEWYEETLDPASILCSELAEMEGVTQGFIYASDDICTEADLAEVEALINDETLLHVYLKPCGGEEYGVLMEKSPVVRGVSASRILLRTYKGIYIYPELAEAFIEFAKSPAGYALLAKFGKKDQVISKAHEKEIPKFKEDGEYQVRKMDLEFISHTLNFATDEDGVFSANGRNADADFKSTNGRFINTIRLNKLLNVNNEYAEAFESNPSSFNRRNFIMSRMATIFHEMVIHVMINVKDYGDDKIMNASPILNDYGEDRRSREGRRIIHHKNAKEIKSLWNTEYVPYITGIWQSFNPGNSSFKIKAHLVNFEL